MKLRIFLIIFVLFSITAFAQQTEETPIWQAANDIRDMLLDAQLELFDARRADDPTIHYQAAVELIDSSVLLYQDVLQADISQYTTESNQVLLDAFTAARLAAENGDRAALGLARGRIWTEMLHASYETTLSALDLSDLDTAEAWLSFREYRQATRVSLVLSPSASALDELQQGILPVDEAIAIIENDLRDTYYFRLRQASNELQTALETNYSIRAAEWLGQLNGYFAIFSSDYTLQMGSSIAITELNEIEDSVLSGDTEAALTHLFSFRDSLLDYQPVMLTDAQIAERAQLLYIFTDLVYIEYKDGVRDGEITLPIEYQEATTFLGQAQSAYDELRAIMEPEKADELHQILTDIQTSMESLDDSAIVQELVKDGKDIVRASFDLDLTNNTAATFTIVHALLDDAEASIRDGRYGDAENIRLQAYALFDFGPEQRLLAFSPQLAVEIDALFWHGDGDGRGLARVIAARGTPDDFQIVREELTASLDEAQIVLGASNEPLTIIINSAIIVFREGLEAVVIIAALSAGMVRVNTQYRKPLFLGAFGAFFVTALTWVIADAFLTLFRDYGERLEAVVSLIALGVLLLITNWFFHKVYWTDHLAGFHQRKSQLLRGEAGKYLGLMILGFTSIYREGFETVLFLQALVLDAGIWVVLQGVLLGLMGVGAVGIITFKMQTKLPYMKMMVATGVLIGVVLIMLVGNTVRVMQVVAWLPVHPIEGVNFPYWWGQWFGTYPTWEGILAQFGAAAFVIGSYYLAEYQASKERKSKSEHRMVSTEA